MTLSLPFLSLTALAVAYAKPLPAHNAARASGEVCCEMLESSLQGLVVTPGEVAYTEGQSDYYVGAQTDLTPACRVSPETAEQVSTIMTIATQNECKFAVVSGGHMSWAASNIGSEGFTIDLTGVDTLEFSDDKSVLRLGPGNRWDHVYTVVQEQGLIVVGGRATHVGVGGFLLGGGVSWLSFEHGWGSSNILAYELVLSNGTIIEVTPETHPDLKKALKFGSTNYGIVTRFDLKTLPTNGIWGGARIHPEEDSRVLLDGLAAITHKINQQTSAFNGVQFFRSAVDQAWLHWVPTLSTAGTEEWPGVLKEIENIGTPSSSTLQARDYVSMANEIFGAQVMGQRNRWWSLNVKVDAQLMEDMFAKGKEAADPLFDSIPGFLFGILIQPITVSMIQASEDLGGDFSGLNVADGDQWLILGSAQWSNSADDEPANSALTTLFNSLESMAAERGKRVPFIYPNYASNLQDVIGSFGADNVASMKEIQQRYDPDLLLPKYWEGGYRL